MDKLLKGPQSLGRIAEDNHQMALLSSLLAEGYLLAELMLLWAAVDGDLRLFKDMVICLNKGQGEAVTVANISYKGLDALQIAVHMRRTVILEYLKYELGINTAASDEKTGHTSEQLLLKGACIDSIICEIKSWFLHAQERRSSSIAPPTASWSDLPSDIVHQIASTFSSAEVYITVRSVCRRWEAALSDEPPSTLHKAQIPFLLLPPQESSKLYTVWKLRNRNSPARDALHLPHLSSTAGRVVVGSCFGWIILLEPYSLSLIVLHPITGERITLPTLWGLHGESVHWSMLVRHAVLSSDPSCSNSWSMLVFLTVDNSSCFRYQRGTNVWSQHVHDQHVIKDVLFFLDCFVALTEDNHLGLFDIDSAVPQIQFILFDRELSNGVHHLVLDCTGQELLLVTTSEFDEPPLTPRHIPLIERLIISSECVDREISKAAGALFLGTCCSVALDITRVPPSVHGGVFRMHTYSRLMGSKGIMHCGGILRTSLGTRVTSHDLLHAQLFCSNGDLWLTWKPWWVTPNIFQSVPRSESTQSLNHNICEAKEYHSSSGQQEQLSSQFAAKANIKAKKISEVHSEEEKSHEFQSRLIANARIDTPVKLPRIDDMVSGISGKLPILNAELTHSATAPK